MSYVFRSVAGCLTALVVLLALAAPASAAIEDYADYQPQTRCSPKPKPGTKALARWLVRRGGGEGPMSRRCRIGGTSEHKEGRAFDWILDATKKRDRRIARDFLDLAFATDRRGNEHAKARRMGIMYIIWNDHSWSSWRHFERTDYLSSSCKRKKKCSKTLRHRDHMHISLSRPGGKGRTSWYDGRVPQG
ncbi:hypothetical protein ACFP3Q_13635 [Nocardioides sp. GCM10027113]|uniref:hypothetical protein n=1 Tax=unclassified Nocardioides TaxID=2615069 RepID=UPI003608053D